MPEIFDMIMMVGDLVLILALFWFIAEAALFFLDEFSGASARIIQEYVSGYASMSGFAPPAFSAEDKFPAVNHMMKITEKLPFVYIKTGTRGTVSSDILTGRQENINIMLTFAQKPPLSYFLSKSIVFVGDCLGNFCAFSGETQNKIRITRDENSVSILLNRESLSTGSLYKLGKKIFFGECNSKTYSADYLFAGTASIKVQVNEDGNIIKDESGENWHEIEIGKTKTINSLKITLFSLDTATNIASIVAECA